MATRTPDSEDTSPASQDPGHGAPGHEPGRGEQGPELARGKSTRRGSSRKRSRAKSASGPHRAATPGEYAAVESGAQPEPDDASSGPAENADPSDSSVYSSADSFVASSTEGAGSQAAGSELSSASASASDASGTSGGAESSDAQAGAAEQRLAQAGVMVRKHALVAMGIGVVPIPIVDLVAASGVALKLVRELALLYDVPFSEQRGKGIIAALVGGVGSGLGAAALFSVAKFIPGVGSLAGMASFPIVVGAMIYAIGQMFTKHFEAGGNLLDFDVAQVRRHFKSEFEQAKSTVAHLREQAGESKR